MIAFLLLLKRFLLAGLSSIVKGITYLLAHPKLLALIVVTGIVLFGAYKAKNYIADLNNQIETLTTANQNLTAKNNQLIIDIKVALQANENNQRIIDELKASSKEATSIVKDLQQGATKNKQSLIELQKQLDKLKAEDNGPVAKVLRDAIIGIQKNREERDALLGVTK